MPRREPPILHDVPFFEVGADANADDAAGHAPDPVDADPAPILGAAPAAPAGIRLAGPPPKRGRGRPRKSAAPEGLMLAGPMPDDVRRRVGDDEPPAAGAAAGIRLDDLAIDDGAADDGAPGGRYVSLSQLATMTGRSRNTVRQWIADGMPVHQRPDNANDGGGWQIDVAAVIAWREERARAAAGMDDDSLMDKEEAQRRKLSAEARMAEYQLARVRQETLMLSDVLHVVSKEYSEVRAGLRSLPARVSQTLAGADAEVLFREMRKEIDKALGALGHDAALQRQVDGLNRDRPAGEEDGGDDANGA